MRIDDDINSFSFITIENILEKKEIVQKYIENINFDAPKNANAIWERPL